MSAPTAPRQLSPGWAWVRLLTMALARAYVAFVLTLALAAMLPAAWGWHSYLVRSGSMEPSIRTGDVVAASPVTTKTQVLGRVVVFTVPGSARTMMHRIVSVRADGLFTTRGDGNRSDDTAPVPRADITGLGRLRIPLIGLPALWLSNGHVDLLVMWVLVSGLAFVAAPQWRGRRSHHPGPGAPSPADSSHRSPSQRGTRRARHAASRAVRMTVWALVLTAVASSVLVMTAAPARAQAFTAGTRNAGNVWTAAAVFTSQYVSTVLADNPYFFYQLDEASGPIAVDSSGNNRAGTYVSVGAYRQRGGVPNIPGYSVALNGGRIVGGGAALANPLTYTLEFWLKTTTTTGGRLIGFESTQNATSPTYDRYLFMDDSGHLVYGAWANPNATSISTPASYNDGAWHYVAVTVIPHGALQQSTLYVDGAQVVTGTTTKPYAYSGWWQAGNGELPAGTGYPTTTAFAGLIDDLAVYQSALDPTRIAARVPGPVGGSVQATGLSGTGGAYSTSRNVTLALAKGTDVSAAISATGAKVLRASAPISTDSTGTCGTYGAFIVIATDPASPMLDASLPDHNCYLYEYVVSDVAGHSTTYTGNDVKVDTSAPSVPGLNFTAGAGAYWSGTGTAVYYRPSATTGSFTASATSTEVYSGVAGYAFPAFPASWTSVASGSNGRTYSYSAPNPTAPLGAQSVTATANNGLTASSSFTVVPDGTAPSGGAVNYVDGFETQPAVNVTINRGVDSGSGINAGVTALQRSTASLTVGVCGVFGAYTTVYTGAATVFADNTVASGNCYRYRATVSDNVGNQNTYPSSSTARVYTAVSGRLTSVSWTSSRTGIGETGATYTYGFTTASAATLSSVSMSVPVGTSGTPTLGSATGVPGLGTLTLTDSVLTYTFVPTLVSASTRITLTVTGLTNTGTAGTYSTEAITIGTRVAGPFLPVDSALSNTVTLS